MQISCEIKFVSPPHPKLVGKSEAYMLSESFVETRQRSYKGVGQVVVANTNEVQ